VFLAHVGRQTLSALLEACMMSSSRSVMSPAQSSSLGGKSTKAHRLNRIPIPRASYRRYTIPKKSLFTIFLPWRCSKSICPRESFMLEVEYPSAIPCQGRTGTTDIGVPSKSFKNLKCNFCRSRHICACEVETQDTASPFPFHLQQAVVDSSDQPLRPREWLSCLLSHDIRLLPRRPQHG